MVDLLCSYSVKVYGIRQKEKNIKWKVKGVKKNCLRAY